MSAFVQSVDQIINTGGLANFKLVVQREITSIGSFIIPSTRR